MEINVWTNYTVVYENKEPSNQVFMNKYSYNISLFLTHPVKYLSIFLVMSCVVLNSHYDYEYFQPNAYPHTMDYAMNECIILP